MCGSRVELAERAGRRSCLQATVLRLQLVQRKARSITSVSSSLSKGLAQKSCAQADGLQGVRVVVLPGEHDDLGVRRRAQDLLQQAHSLGWFVGVRRQAEVHGDDRGDAPDLRERLFRLPADTGAYCSNAQRICEQGRIVLDDQQR